MVAGHEGEADRATPFEIHGSIDATGTSLTFTQRYTVAPHPIRYWRAEVSRDGRTMRGVWASNEDGVAVDGATWKSSRGAPDSINFGLLTRRGRGVVEFSARRIDTADDWRTSTGADADASGFGSPQRHMTAGNTIQGRSPRLNDGGHRYWSDADELSSWERSVVEPRSLRTQARVRSPYRSTATSYHTAPFSESVRVPVSSVALRNDERQELLDRLDEQVARAKDAERRLHRVEQELGCTRDALAAAEQRAMVAEEWRKHAETKQLEAESCLLEAGDVRDDALFESEEAARELSAHQERIRETERELSSERRERLALQHELEKANSREAAMEKALDSMTNQLGAFSEAAAAAAATAGTRGIGADQCLLRKALMCQFSFITLCYSQSW